MSGGSERNKLKLVIPVIILVISVGLTAFFAAALWLDIRTTRQGQEFFEALAAPVVPRPVIARIAADPEPVPPYAAASGDEDEAEPEPYEPQVLVPDLDFDSLRELYPSIVGWIQSPGTVINYPIVQGPDNEFYLYRLPNQARHRMGSIFLDYRNEADFSSPNIFIYGHNMSSGDKFGSFRHYRNQQFFEEHDSMFIFTPDANYLVVLFAGYIIDSSVEVPPMGFDNEAHFDRYIADLRRRSIFRSNIEVAYGDQLVFLCTCYGAAGGPLRLILVGKLLELDCIAF